MNDSKQVPMLSIIIPIYNVEKYIEQCLRSIAGQTYKDFEVLMIDDGSTDGSAGICKFFAMDKRFVYVYKKNGGVSSARNTGLDMAKGKYLSFVDPDDYISSNFYELIISVMDEEEADICVCDEVRMIGEKGEIIQGGHTNTRTWDNDFYEAIENAGLVWDKIFRKELFDSARFNVELENYEDLEIFAKILHPSVKLRYVKNTSYFYRVRGGSLSNRFCHFSYFRDLERASESMEQLCRKTIHDEKCLTEIIHLFAKHKSLHQINAFKGNVQTVIKEHTQRRKSILADLLDRMQNGG